MAPNIPLYLNVVFLALVGVILYWLGHGLRVGVQRARLPKTFARAVLVALLLWLTLLAVLAFTGFFEVFEGLPPRLVLILVPMIGVVVWAARSETVGQLVDGLPAPWLVYPQAFRVVMEVILWLLFVEGAIPQQMTFEGYNFDVLVGVTAPLVAYFGLHRRAWPRWALFGWHVVSFALLVNIVTIAILSTPTQLQYFTEPPFNTMVAYFPFVWLPGLVVPFAFLLHVLGVRQLLRQAP